MTRKITVLHPEGNAPTVGGKSLAPRPATLDGRTVFLVDAGFENSGEFIDQLRASFEEHRPDVTTVTARLASPFDPAPELYARIAEEGDAAILGVGL
ncbi:hypothetical protein BZB76_2337 [Actinomadura pelletieri DSM 43383]|uniref:UGSC-like domain-containing protein n=2 Tax=Actinomadura pelletieri TaxID=111805 RepID=A0A495QU34_9ACTN|nr:hypothetical protein [Actinomadura pelletieri]RKS76968.1 hypothetical protein BZB76_2337 [Actinomadura pelletieri DSM 43383]